MQESTYKRQKKRTTLRLQPTDAMITLLFGPGFYSRLSAYELFFYCWKASKWPSAASHRIFFVCSACYQLNSTARTARVKWEPLLRSPGFSLSLIKLLAIVDIRWAEFSLCVTLRKLMFLKLLLIWTLAWTIRLDFQKGEIICQLFDFIFLRKLDSSTVYNECQRTPSD